MPKRQHHQTASGLDKSCLPLQMPLRQIAQVVFFVKLQVAVSLCPSLSPDIFPSTSGKIKSTGPFHNRNTTIRINLCLHHASRHHFTASSKVSCCNTRDNDAKLNTLRSTTNHVDLSTTMPRVAKFTGINQSGCHSARRWGLPTETSADRHSWAMI